jgi:hypothetical protein
MNGWVVIFATSLTIIGCSRSKTMVIAPEPQGSRPTADSPENAARLLAWVWDHRDTASYRSILTSDYLFVSGAGDSSSLFDLTTHQELSSAANLFARGTDELPPARRIVLDLDPALFAVPDPRPGRDPLVHREISTGYSLSVDTEARSFRIVGRIRIFVVHGDSASLTGPGSPPDSASSLWWVDRVEELLTPAATLRVVGPDQTLPVRRNTWAELKTLYLP